jgi:hypothetical protein
MSRDRTLADLRWIQNRAEAEANTAREAGLYAYVSPLRDIARRAARIEKRILRSVPPDNRGGR